MKTRRYEIKNCRHPWDTMHVISTGDVRCCCWMRDPIGNLNEQSAEEIWNGDIINRIREYIKQNKVHPYCDTNCPFNQNYTITES